MSKQPQANASEEAPPDPQTSREVDAPDDVEREEIDSIDDSDEEEAVDGYGHGV